MSERRKTLIGAWTAALLYLLLCVGAALSLKGEALALALVIVVGLAAKSYLHYWKERRSGED